MGHCDSTGCSVHTTKVIPAGAAPDNGQESITAKAAEAARVHAYLQVWRHLESSGITATQFIEFLKPLANLDGLEVTHVYQGAQSLSPVQADSESQLQKRFAATEKVLSFGLNQDGRLLIQSNFVDLN